MDALDQRLINIINSLRELSKEYALKPEEEQKKIRNKIYINTGKFGKEVVPLFASFKTIEDDLITKGQA